MPRRPAVIERDIPLYLVPYIVRRGVYTHGEALERVDVKKIRRHFYAVSIRTRPLKRELEGRRHSHDTPESPERGDEGGQE